MREVVFCVLCLLSVNSFGQNGDFRLGARNSGMGGSSAALEDGWAVYNNVAGLGSLENSTAMLAYQNRFDISALQVIGAAYVHHTKFVNAGISFYRFGDALFNQQKMSLAFANKIDKVSLGAAVNLIQYDIETLGTRSVVVIEFGGIAHITPRFSFAGYVYNVNQASLIAEERIPTLLKAGIAYLPAESICMTAEVQKDLDFDEIIKAGLEYEVIEHVWVRTGISTNPFRAAFGAGARWNAFQMDYALNDQTDLGMIHEFSVTFRLGKP